MSEDIALALLADIRAGIVGDVTAEVVTLRCIRVRFDDGMWRDIRNEYEWHKCRGFPAVSGVGWYPASVTPDELYNTREVPAL